MDAAERIARALECLKKSLAESSNGEAYETIERNESYRVGLVGSSGDVAAQYSIELVLRVFEPSAAVDLPSLERTVHSVRSLQELGYSVCHEDDGWLHCEKRVELHDLRAECERVLNALNGHYAKKAGFACSPAFRVVAFVFLETNWC